VKRRRRSKVSLWFAWSQAPMYTIEEQQYLIDKAWRATKEGEAFLAEWRADLEARAEVVRRILEKTESMSDALKRTYPDNFAPAPLEWKP
jgi:hypothetical protein